MNHLYQEINNALYHTYHGIQRIEEEELKKSRFNDLTPKKNCTPLMLLPCMNVQLHLK